MSDDKTTIEELKKIVTQFIEERDWTQFHTPKNMSMALTVEAGELLEHFLWTSDKDPQAPFKEKRTLIEHEIADIFTCLLAFCYENNIDLSRALKEKIRLNKVKYPIEQARGNNKKYSEFN